MESTPELVSREHHHLSDLIAEVQEACRAGADAAALRSLGRELREAMDAHFVREEALYYPTVWALRADLERPLRALVRAHEVFRLQLSTIDAALSDADTPEAGRLLAGFRDLFTLHERAEEACLGGLGEPVRPAV